MSAVDDVKQKIDIVDVIGQYVTLKKAGRNFKALCPFHNEKTPSFVVFPDQGTWHCFGACNTGGDVFAFLMRRENLDFGEALRRLAQRAGVELVREAPGEDAERKRWRDLLAQAAGHYHYLLKNHPEAQGARDYLSRRHVSSEAIEAFELGYALNSWDGIRSYLVGRGSSLQDLEAAGLVIKSDREGGGFYDRFRGRLMFPIRNRNSQVIGFGARTLGDDEPKYLNSPQTALFDKSGTLYGLDLAKDAIRSQNLAVIVEGYMDVIGAHQAGFKNVVASLGTALTEKQLGLLKRLTTRYALALDPDAAGEEATKRGLQLAREALDRKTVPVPMGAGLVGYEERLEAELLVISMPPGQDPDELIYENPGHWSELVERSEPLVDFFFRVLTQDLDLGSARGKSIAVNRLKPIIQEIGDAVKRTHYAQQLARLVHVPEQTIAQELTHTRRTPRAEPPRPQLTYVTGLQVTLRLEEYCLVLALRAPQHLARLYFLDTEVFQQTEHRLLFEALREQAKSQPFDGNAFLDSIDASLRQRGEELMAQSSKLAEMDDLDLQRELERIAYRLRRQRDKDELTQIELELRDRDSEQTAEDESSLRERAEYLRRRISDGDKALAARTLFRPRPHSMTGTGD